MPSRPPSLSGTARRSGLAQCPRPRGADGRPLAPLEQRRSTAAERGYGHRWAQCRKRLLARNPLCAACQKKGLLVPATLVDHIEPVSGSSDPKFYALSNLQPLCRACHAKKTWSDTRQGKNRGSADRRRALRPPRAAAPDTPVVNLFYA